jgi:DNA polymerase-3 subunit delta
MIFKVEALRKRLQQGQFDPVYFLHGEEDYLKEEIVQILEKAFINESWTTFDRLLYYGGESPIGSVIQSLLTPPIASKRKLVILKDLQKLKDKEKEELLNYVKNPENDVCLVLIAPSVNTKEKFYAALAKNSATTIFYKPFEWNLPKWVRDYLSSKGYSIDREALNFILEVTQTQLGNLANELDKLLTFVGNKKTITIQDLAWISGHSKKNDIFQFTKAIGNKDVTKGFQSFENLLLWNEKPTRILAMITRHFTLLLKLKDLQEMKAGKSEISSRLKMSEFYLKDYIRQSSHYSREDLVSNLAHVYRLEKRIKSGMEKGPFGFESLILQVCHLSN